MSKLKDDEEVGVRCKDGEFTVKKYDLKDWENWKNTMLLQGCEDLDLFYVGVQVKSTYE